MPPSPDKPEAMALVDLGDALSGFFDPDWYVARHLGIDLTQSQRETLAAAFRAILDNNLAQPRVYVHRVPDPAGCRGHFELVVADSHP